MENMLFAQKSCTRIFLKNLNIVNHIKLSDP